MLLYVHAHTGRRYADSRLFAGQAEPVAPPYAGERWTLLNQSWRSPRSPETESMLFGLQVIDFILDLAHVAGQFFGTLYRVGFVLIRQDSAHRRHVFHDFH